MKKVIFSALLAAIVSLSAFAEDARFRQDHPDNYTVQKGDTLWGISGTFLENPWMWPEIWHVNPQIGNPHLIYPGDVIRLIYVDGKPVLTLDRGDAGRTYKMSPTGGGSNGDVKLSPSVRVRPAAEAIPAIPLDKVVNFLSRSRVVTNEQLLQAPHVVAGARGKIIVGAGDDLYVRDQNQQLDPSVGVYGIYRKGIDYKDPKTGEYLGTQALDIGTVKLRTMAEEVATMRVVRTTEEVDIGDRLLQDEERAVDAVFYPSAPENELEGEILQVEGGVSQVGKLDVVVINRGEREALEVGDVLAIYKKGETVRDRVGGGSVKLPDERAGLMMVFRAFEKVSLGLVLEADRPLSTGDIVKKP